jgi:Ca2+-binding RTX toxin-like protein
MSKSKLGSNTPVNDGIGTPVNDAFNRFEVGTTTDDVDSPGFEVGIGVSTGGVASPDNTPAGGDTSSGAVDGDFGGVLTWDSLSQIDQVAIAEDNDELTQAKGAGAGVDPNAANPAGGNVGQLLTLGTNPDGSHFFTGNRNVDATLIGSKWGITNLTYSFPTSGSVYNGATFDTNGVSNYQITLGTQQQAAARAAFAQLAAATGLTFTEITDTDTVHANIRISQSADTDDGSAYGNFPSDTRGMAGDIWFGRTNQPYYDMAYKGTWGYATMMHEIGHTMGLKHGHQDYTNSDLSFYFGTTPRFGSQSLTPDRDGQAWSLMTYTPAPFTNSNFAGEKINQPQTYMQYDLAALQYLYGANFNTNNGDSVYTFSQTTGEMFINGIGQGAPSGNKIFLTIWDGGGNDTIDASNYANGVTIDLRPGEFSTVDQAQLANSLAYQNLVSLAPGNFAMSLLYNNDVRSLIENAKGGVGNDIFIGNSANNVLDGGAGSDTVIFTGTTGINVTLNDTNTDVIVTHDGETDTLRSIENIQGTIGNDTLIGNSQNNTLSGGVGGTDILSGGFGDDRLIGGGFTVVNNALITKAQATANIDTANAINPQTLNAYTLLADSNVTNSTTVPHATINATAAGGGLEYYRLDVTAGTSGIFDIDFSSIDTWIELVDSTGTVLLAQNDDSIADAGSQTGNSYLTYTFAAAGTYYIRVGRWTAANGIVADPLVAGTTYTLNISLSSATVNTAPLSAANTSSATLDGGEGNDLLQGSLGNDTLTGGNGNDTASFATAFSNTAAGVTVNLNLQGGAQNTGAAGTDTLTGIENLVGSQYNDTLTGDSGANIIEGGLGNDTLIGGAGDDTASYASATTGVTVSLALQGAAQNTVGAGTDTLTGFQNLLGSAFSDSLTGDAAENVITGGAGDDTLNPGANVGGSVDLLDGGIGTDTASFAGFAAAVTATLNGASDGTAALAGGTIAALRSIENLTGGDGADVLTGDSNANLIEGGLGDDVLEGGGGIDTVSFRGATAATVDLSNLAAQATGYGNDTITGFENVRTGSGADNITGDGNDNIFFDGGGADTYNGAAGADTVDYSNATLKVTVNLNTATAQAALNNDAIGGQNPVPATANGAAGDILTNIENVTGSLTAANTINGGNSTANRIVGGAAADYLIGNGLGDTLVGGAGNDVIFGDYVNSFSTTVGIADGNDVLEGGAGSDSLIGGAGNDILRGGDGDDTLVGGIGNATVTSGVAALTTVYTNDGGDDTFDGGDGTDTAYAYFTDHTGAIAFDLRGLEGNSTITTGGVATGAFISIERVIFRGGSGNDDVHGTGFLDTLVGNAGNDILDGFYGNDTLSGGLGDDTLIGGEGLDTATYVNATAGVNVDLRILTAQDTGGEGIDTLSGIEYLTGSQYGDTLRGNDVFNLIIDNVVDFNATAGSQSDSIYGYGGNDSILVTRAATTTNPLNAGQTVTTAATNILMDGGDGDDLIQLISGTVTTTTADPDGLSSGGTYALPGRSGTRFLDNVTVYAGNGNDRVVLTGVDAATVDLGSGNDVLSISTLGTAGFNDYDIVTGTGQDTIWFAGSSATQATVIARNNIIRDFTVGDLGDRLELRTASGATYAATSWVNTTNFLNLGANTADLFDSGHFRLLQSGVDILFQVDRDGSASATNGFITIAVLSATYTGGFTTFNFDGMIGSLNLAGQGVLDETLTGASKNDTLSGNDGNDVLIGLAGNDTLDGGNGNDLLRGGVGDDTLIGGAGDDTATYSDATVGVTVNLSLTSAQNTVGAGTDTLTGIENLIGSAFGDTLTGDTAANRIDAGDGDDTLDGGDGDDLLRGGLGADLITGGLGVDTATYSDAAIGVTVDLSVTVAQDTVGAGSDTLGGIENLIGSAFGDDLTGDAGANRIDAGDGDDTVAGGAGNDELIGGLGIDTLDYTALTNAIQVNLAVGFAIAGAQGGNDQISGFENANLGSGNDLFVGDGLDNVARGNDGDDILFGAGGSDELSGGIGIDQLFGGDGGDLLDGGEGKDYMNGGAGDDVYVVDDSGDEVSEFGGSGIDLVKASASFVLGTGVENLVLTGTAAINGTGNALVNNLTGNSAANILDGGAGNDVMTGGDGDDTYLVESFGDQVIEAGGEGNDSIYTTTSYVLGAGQSVETMAARDNSLTVAMNLLGNELANTIFGNNGTNFIDGGAGADIMTGFGGDDTYAVDNAGDVVIEQAGGGNDAIYTSFSYILGFGSSVETLAARDNSLTVAMDLFGNELDNLIFGNNGANFLDGGTGADTMTGFGGDDIYAIDNVNDRVVEDPGQGNDAIYTTLSYVLDTGHSIETLAARDNSLTDALDLTGNELANSVLGNNGANVLNGGLGSDVLVGYGGADTFAFTTALGANNVDTVADFVHGTDKIALDDAVFTAIGGLGALNANAFVTGTAAVDADDRIIYDAETGQLFYDADGSGSGAAILFAQLSGSLSLTASDFQVI